MSSGGGNSIRAKLESVWRQTGNKPKELDELVELPQSCWQVWKWFLDLHNSRSSGAYSANPLSYADIKAYFDLIDIRPDDWELDLIRKWDIVVINEYAEQSKKESKKSKK